MGVDEFVMRDTDAYMENKKGMDKYEATYEYPCQKVDFTIKIYND